MSGVVQGRVAIVTGGARGIGFAIAQSLVMHGARVLIADNGCAVDGGPEDSVVAEAAVDRCESLATGHAIAFTEDLAAEGAAERAVALARERFGALDIVVNNATIERGGSVLGTGRAAFEHVITNDLVAPFAMLAAAAPALREQARAGREPGAIVNVTSTAGLYGRPGSIACAAAKAGVVGLTRATALDLARYGITCNAVAPFAATRLTATMQPRDEEETLYKMRALTVPASYAANLVVWLASRRAAGISGQLFAVRGREILLFSQPRPIATVFAQPGVLDAEAMSDVILDQFHGDFAELISDLEVFNIDPVL